MIQRLPPICTLGPVTSKPAKAGRAGEPLGHTPVLSDHERLDLIERIGPLVTAFVAAGHRFFLVGGLVRDALLGHGLTGDIDVTTDAAPERTAELLTNWADTVWHQGRLFGTIGARRDDTTVEITTHRAESYEIDSRKPNVRFSKDISTDLSRRDFTVNAMAVELPHWTLWDPHDGLRDLANGVLRTPSPPEGLFADDPLRMLRAARFSAQLSLVAEPELVAAVRSSRARLAIVSRERIQSELTKLLKLPQPAAGIHFLNDTGLLADLVPPWRHAKTSLPIAGLDAMTAEASDELNDELVARRWAMLLGAVCDETEATHCLSALRYSSPTISRVAAILRASSALAEAATRPAAASNTGAMRAARRLIAEHEKELDAAQANLASWGRTISKRFAARLAEVRAAEGDALARLPLDGHQVMDILGCSGAAVGNALSWLRLRQFELGPLTTEQARELLVEWHQENRG